ncbi:hypothetical protein M422DRAFT_181207, partial [Sphaerobolus stellatus SS14]
LTKCAFLTGYNSIWTSCGFPRYTRHSFRIGGTTELHSSGVHPGVVKALGRWSSDAFLFYWRSIHDIASIHIADLADPPSNL